MNREYTLQEITSFVTEDHTLIRGTHSNPCVVEATTIKEGHSKAISWVAPGRKDELELLTQSKAAIVICELSNTTIDQESIFSTLILVKSPKKTFVNILRAMYPDPDLKGIHPSAIIHPEATISPSAYIGPNSIIGKCFIGADSMLYGNNYIFDNCHIAERVTILPGTVIGGPGFGFAKDDSDEFIRFPHIGGVIIESDVEIGSNSCIDRGTLGNTHIHEGVKIDNLVHIAHNVIIGKNSVIIANAMIGGSTVIGEQVWVAPSSSIRDGLTIEQHALVGMGSVITKNMPAHEVWFGNPAKSKK